MLAQRWVWFVLGVVTIPTLSFVRDRFGGPDPKSLLPYGNVREEFTRTFRGDNDYEYTLRSKGSREEFKAFVSKMKMDGYRVDADRYEKKERDGRMLTTVRYVDGWITYREFFN